MQTPDLALDQLQSSGLGSVPLQDLDWEYLTAEQTQAIHPGFAPCPSLRINYHDPRTGKRLSHLPKWPAFFRIRYVGPLTPVDKKGTPIRYMQPPNLGVCAYFPPILAWREIIEDPSISLVITEGEKKAAKACLEGFPTIGLGGVSNITSRKTGVHFLPELEAINWVQRKVWIVFDHDKAPKPDVYAAANRLADELRNRGAMVYYVNLPAPGPNVKVGLDDYLCSHTRQEFAQLLGTSSSFTISEPLWTMNTEFSTLLNPHVVVSRTTGAILKPETFTSYYRNRLVPEQRLTQDGEISMKLVPTAAQWLSWPLRTSAVNLVYQPGQDEFTESGDYNVWKGWGCEPKKGDIKLLHELLGYIFGNDLDGRAARKWFLQWCAYPIQHPGAKLYTSALLWSPEHGTGKTLLGYMMREIYGRPNFEEIGQEQLHGRFTGWAEHKQFILGDEITGSDRRELADRLKSLITRETIRIDIKGIPDYSLPNMANFMLTSNRPNALYLEDDDRRFFVWEVKDKAPQELFTKIDRWYRSPEGASAIHHYMLQVDVSDFDPNAPAPGTQAKEAMTETGLSTHAAWVRRLKDNPNKVLVSGKTPLVGDLFTARELLRLFETQEGKTGVAQQGISVELHSAMMPQLKQVRWGAGNANRDRFYVVRNAEKWLKASPEAIRKHVEATKGGK